MNDNNAGLRTETELPRIHQPDRQAIYIPAGDTSIFGWLHRASGIPHKNCVAIVCPPLGYEYTHSHRSVRHLADHLARNGIAAIRFDYHGTGDSPGTDSDSDRVGSWQRDIEAAVDYAKHVTGCTNVCLIGIRLGAALAALVAKKCAADFLVLWNPCISGRRYLREMQVISASAATPQSEQSGLIESAGFAMTAATAEQIKAIDLLALDFSASTRTLIVHRDDFSEDRRLLKKMQTDGIRAEDVTLPGYADMMAEPQFTVIPHKAIDDIVQWLKTLTDNTNAEPNFAQEAPQAIRFITTDTSGKNIALTEQICNFGADNRLFGVLSFLNSSANSKPVVVLLNSGSVHHVGPNRLYVTLSRTLSTLGYTCFRFDLEGLGDSVLLNNERENHPYPDSAIGDVNICLQYLSKQHGASRFVLLGLCSGAHAAFHAGVDLNECDIADIISINPLTFRYVEGMSLETTQHFQDVAYYKNSARNINSWLKLLKGKVDVKYIAGIVFSQLKIAINTTVQSLRERLLSSATTPLSLDIKTLFAKSRVLSLFVAERDPGYALLLAGAKYTATQAIKSGKIRLQFIANADHTFSASVPRAALIKKICEHLENQFGDEK